MSEAVGSLSSKNRSIQLRPGTRTGRKDDLLFGVATIRLVAVAIVPGHSPTGVCRRRGEAVGCPLGQPQTQEQREVEDDLYKDEEYNYARDEYLMTKTTPTPDVVDDDDCTAIQLQIPPPMTDDDDRDDPAQQRTSPSRDEDEP